MEVIFKLESNLLTCYELILVIVVAVTSSATSNVRL